jgi:curved DNA-binding protein CbpA
MLSTRQREALDFLIELGAPLEPNFTRDELRSAFRWLARRYHPDAHPGITAREKSNLSIQFATLRERYELLTHVS